MSSSPRAAIVGVAESDLGRTPDKTVLQLQAQAARAALDDAGLAFNDVDALFCAGNWAWSPGLMLAEYLGLRPRYTDTTNIGGSSFEAHIEHAVAGIEAGLFNVALITYGSTQRSDRSRNRGNVSFKLTEQYEPPFGLPTPVGAYALAAMRHMFEFGTTSEQLAEVAVATRKWATLKINDLKNSLLEFKPELTTGSHVSVPTVLEEDYQQRSITSQLHINSIDNEISQIAFAIRKHNQEQGTGISFSAVHFATDYVRQLEKVELETPFDLSNNRSKDAREGKTKMIRKISLELLHYLKESS
jgi:hypothetical protein